MNPFEPENCADQEKETLDWQRSRRDLWVAFFRKYRVAEDSVPLFDCEEGGFVRTREIGKPRPRKLLRRSEAMEIMMQPERWDSIPLSPLYCISDTSKQDSKSRQ